MSKSRLQSMGMGIIVFLMGSMIYFAFRTSELYMFRIFPNGDLPSWIIAIRNQLSSLHVPEWIRYCLPDGLWLLSYMLIIESIWNEETTWLHELFLWILPISAILTEFLQMALLIPGTGDWIDVIFYVMGILTFLIYKNLQL